MSKQQILNDAAAMLRGYVSGGPLKHRVEGRVIYPQRVAISTGSFFLEAMSDARIAVIPMSEIVTDWESAH